MNQFVSKHRTNAFTLVEMLVVIAIIGILASVLLPALNSSQRRAQRIWCENNLQQMGIAFHVFANDHSGKFPMAVPAIDGGSMESVQNGFNAGDVFYTSFHSFQSLSNELVRTEILTCLADLARNAASNFPSVENENLSYFIGVNASFDKPGSILAGDRNLATNSFETPTILQIGPNSRLSWTWEIHRFQGNVLFSDSHVEEWNNSSIKTGEGQISPNENLFLPSVVPSANTAPGAMNNPPSSPNNGPGPVYPTQPSAPQSPPAGPATQSSASPSSSPGSSSQSPSMPSPSPGPMMPVSGGSHQQLSRTDFAPSPSESSSDSADTTSTTASNAVIAVALPGEPNSMMSPFDQHLNKVLLHSFEWLYLILLLLMLLFLIRKIRKWRNEREEKQHAKRMRKDSPWD
jgi:prepilin-type N-terminal cleavage/methylation domain-containing protein